MADEKKEQEHVNLKVVGQDGSIVQFKIKKHTALRKLMTTYCERAGLSMPVVRFRFDGQPITENDTPSSLEMEEGDTIEVFQQQTGGYGDGSLCIALGERGVESRSQSLEDDSVATIREEWSIPVLRSSHTTIHGHIKSDDAILHTTSDLSWSLSCMNSVVPSVGSHSSLQRSATYCS